MELRRQHRVKKLKRCRRLPPDGAFVFAGVRYGTLLYAYYMMLLYAQKAEERRSQVIGLPHVTAAVRLSYFQS